MDIQKTAEWLRNIEILNTESRDVVEKLEKIPNVLEEMKTVLDQEIQVIAHADETIKSQTEKISKLKTEITESETELKTSEERATSITNQKEYQAIQKEIESLKSRKEHLASQIETEQKSLEELETKRDESKSFLTNHELTYKDHAPKAKSILKELTTKQADLKKRINNMESELPETVTSAIQRLAKHNVYPFTSEATPDSVCSVCHMGYPPQIVLNGVNEGNFSQCPHCHRLLIPGKWVFETS
jgi:uncharacterized protein